MDYRKRLIMSIIEEVPIISVWRLSKISFILDNKLNWMAFEWSKEWYAPTPVDIASTLEELLMEEYIGYKLCPKISVVALKSVNNNRILRKKVREVVQETFALSPMELLERVYELKGMKPDCWTCEIEMLIEEVNKGKRDAMRELIGRLTEQYSDAIKLLPFMSLNKLEEALVKIAKERDLRSSIFILIGLLQDLRDAASLGNVKEIIRARKRLLDSLRLFIDNSFPKDLMSP
ncbi:hypothetical protein IPA_07440 [Ignicoccus pacificus DSM 13166]|uniref:Uncharacterized protein n=1 Tax=Ignicoccus pacificus DSM 13166 TaxID=940294 RepID=A0A977PL53_9CREN|nr:hypothetical protein IPA_07440 [Ignicoccus pacificus DSM 13166]